MGVKGTDDMTQEEYRKAAVDAVRKLSQDVGIPANLKDIVKEEDIPFLAQSAYDDACRPGNPRETSVEEITELLQEPYLTDNYLNYCLSYFTPLKKNPAIPAGFFYYLLFSVI